MLLQVKYQLFALFTAVTVRPRKRVQLIFKNLNNDGSHNCGPWNQAQQMFIGQCVLITVPSCNKTTWRSRNAVSLYVPATSQLRLKLNTQRRLIGTSPRRLSGTYPRRPISTSLRRLL